MRRDGVPLPSRRVMIALLVSLILLVAGSIGSIPGPPSPAAAPVSPRVDRPAPTALPAPSPAAAATAAATAPPAAAKVAIPSLTPALPSFSGAEALQQIQMLAGKIGARPSGSPAAAQTAQYLEGQFAALGYDARLQSYRDETFLDRLTQLRLEQPELLEIAAKAFVYSASGTVEGRLVDCGSGRAGDFPASGLQGQVALIERGGTGSFTEKVAAAVARGAAGAILYNDRSGEFRGTLDRQISIPVVGILQYDGKRLQEMLRRSPVTLSLKTEVSSQPLQGSNVVASLKPTAGRNRVVIGAHYDSVSTPGANDNASGVAVLLQLASAVRGQRYPFDLAFVAFGDEELGLVGSRQYLESMAPVERSRIAAMINLDMVGVGDSLQFGGDGELVRRLLAISTRMGYEASELVRGGAGGSDHASFLVRGIPAVFVHRAEDPNYHTPLDTPDRITASNLEAAGNVVLRLLSDLNP